MKSGARREVFLIRGGQKHVRCEERLGGLFEVLLPGGSLVKEGELQWAGFNLAGLLCLVLMGLLHNLCGTRTDGMAEVSVSVLAARAAAHLDLVLT
jgi:hypothetical protein